MNVVSPVPNLSIVVAAWPDTNGLTGVLAALSRQLDTGVEVLAVGRATQAPFDQMPRVRWIGGVWGQIPDLWSAGIREAKGDVVAISTTQFSPNPGWVAAIRVAHARLDAPAIGGPIAPPRGRGSVAWATYFLRYSAYLNYWGERAVPDLAGDNASYKRPALAEYRKTEGVGFWELDLHRKLIVAGQRLVFVPEMQITQVGSFGFGQFLRQRFDHGYHFGSYRMATNPIWLRLAAIATSPLIPLILTCKLAHRVVRSRRDFVPFLLSLPALLCFVAAWSLGEAFGYATPHRSKSRHVDTGRGHRQPAPTGVASPHVR